MKAYCGQKQSIKSYFVQFSNRDNVRVEAIPLSFRVWRFPELLKDPKRYVFTRTVAIYLGPVTFSKNELH